MALYDIGDLIFNEYATTGRLLCDGSAVSEAAYPRLKAAIIDSVPQTINGQPPPAGYFFLPSIFINTRYPDMPVLIQAEEV